MTNSYAYRVDPSGTESLGKGNTREKYKECLPGVYADTYVLEELLRSSTIQFCGPFSKPLHLTTPHTSKDVREIDAKNLQGLKIHSNQLEDTLLMSALVGKKQIGYIHKPLIEFVRGVRIKNHGIRSIGSETRDARFNLVALEFSLLDIETGEIYSSLPGVVRETITGLDLGCLIYRIGIHDYAALVNFGHRFSYDDALDKLKQISRLINKKGSYKVSARNSSLFNVFPLPLSITRDGLFCELLDVPVSESITRLKEFLLFTSDVVETRLPQEETTTIEEAGEEEQNIRWRKDHDFVVTRAFYTGINRVIGRDKNKDKIRKLLGYLLFSSFKDSDDNLILSSSKLCTLFDGNDKRVLQNNFNLSATLKLLDPFASITTGQHIYKDKKATILKTAEFNEDINVLAAEEYKSLRRDLVWLSNGESCNTFEKQLLQSQREKANKEDSYFEVEIAKKLLLALNSLPAHTFSGIYNEGIISALDAVSLLPLSKQSTAREQLKGIRLQPIPIYSIKPGTSRIYPEFNSFAFLNKGIRKQFFRGRYIADLKHCHLSIFSMLWNVEELVPYLKEEDSWASLESLFSLPKPILKELIMPLLYGETRGAFNDTTATTSEIETFLSHPIILSLLEKKAKFLKRADELGYALDAYNNKIIQRGHHYKQLLSQISQSYEFLILEEIYKSYLDLKDKNTSKRFNILLYLFDGFIFDCNHRDFQRVAKDMEITTTKKLLDLQIPTKLVIEKI